MRFTSNGRALPGHHLRHARVAQHLPVHAVAMRLIGAVDFRDRRAHLPAVSRAHRQRPATVARIHNPIPAI